MSTQSSHLSSICPSLDFTWPPSPDSGLYFYAVVVQLDSESSPQQLVRIPKHNTLNRTRRKKGYDDAVFSLFQSFVNCDGLIHGVETTVTLRDDFCSLSVARASRTKMPTGLPGVPLISLSRESRAHKRRGDASAAPRTPALFPFSIQMCRRPVAATHSSESFGEPTVTSHVGVLHPPPPDRSTPRVTNPKGLFSQNRV